MRLDHQNMLKKCDIKPFISLFLKKTECAEKTTVSSCALHSMYWTPSWQDTDSSVITISVPKPLFRTFCRTAKKNV
ncbi:hypothetical protein GFK82_00434 [Candidatus Steffania adelgidicola]|nr:hypothetical protein GFK82_00434 [Candidatus Steffania adelgidicola]